MRRVILPALLLLLCALPTSAQYGRYGGRGAREAERTVAGWYDRYLGREMDPGAATWIRSLQQGQDPERVLATILGSDEYYTRAGGSPAAFVRRLFDDVGNRRPTQREMDYWVHQVRHRNRDDVAYGILTRNAQNYDDDRDHHDNYDYRRSDRRYR